MKNLIIIACLLSLFTACAKKEAGSQFFAPNDPNIVYVGRFDLSDSTKPVFMYSGCAIRTKFTGTSIELIMKDDSLRNYFTVLLDDSLFVMKSDSADSSYVLASTLKDTIHSLEIIRRSEWHGGNTTFLGFNVDAGATLQKPEIKERKMEFIGNSYTCGYGNEGLSQTENFKYETENNYLTFGAITARALDADYVAICRSGIGIIQGYGGIRSFTMPRYYDEIINDSTRLWNYANYQPHVVVLDLAGNDLSAKLDQREFIAAYVAFVKRIRTNYRQASIICVAGPSSEDKKWPEWKDMIHKAVSETGKEDNKVYYFEFTPFIPHGSDWHPNIEEHEKMADELIPFVKQLMNW